MTGDAVDEARPQIQPGVPATAEPAAESGLGAIDPHLRRLALVVVIGTIMSILDTTIVNVAIATLARDFRAPLSTVQWVSTGYLLALAAVIPLTGWAVEHFGHLDRLGGAAGPDRTTARVGLRCHLLVDARDDLGRAGARAVAPRSAGHTASRDFGRDGERRDLTASEVGGCRVKT
ncbi:MAG: MFS transporter [Acidimicrobiales bacterium]